MDVLWFLNRRMGFVRDFYTRASKPFVETMDKISNAEAPFDDPPYSEDGEPAFLAEWQDADEAIDFLGQSCISFIAASVKLYLVETEREFRRMWGRMFPFPDVKVSEEGIVSGYEDWFRSLGIDFRSSGADIELIREVVATRNLAQHPASIGLMRLSQRPVDREKFPRPFFGHPLEKQIHDDEPSHEFAWMLSITPEAIAQSVNEVVKFGEWLDAQSLAGPKAMPQTPAEDSPGEPVGVVTRYLGRIQVAGVRLAADIAVGDTLRFLKNKRDFEMEVTSLQLNNVAVQTAAAGTEVGIQVNQVIGERAAVYRTRRRAG
jgi:hypothetical protein